MQTVAYLIWYNKDVVLIIAVA